MSYCPACGTSYDGETPRCPLDGQALVQAPDPFVGAVLSNKYRIHQKLGEGAMGCVYLARHIDVEHPFAIKILSPSIVHDEVIRKRFLREAKASNIVGHENIVHVYDVDSSDEVLYFVMEYVEGESLAALIGREGRLPPAVTIHVLAQVCEAIGLAHIMGVIHRDIKPGNILITRRKDDPLFVKILDFGLAQVVSDPRLTTRGIALGTPWYVSPEQARGGKPQPSMDLYSIGCVAYEMLAGKPPFDGEGPLEIIEKQMHDQPAPIGRAAPGVPRELAAVVMRLLAKKPDERHRDAYQVLHDLKAALAAARAGGDTDETFPGRRRPPAGAGAAAPSAPPAPPVRRQGSCLWRAYIEDTAKPSASGTAARGSVSTMEKLSAELARLEKETAAAAQEIEARQEKARAGQIKMSRALGELGNDLSGRGARAYVHLARLADLDAELRPSGEALLAAIGKDEAIAGAARAGKMTPDAAGAISRCGALALAWRGLHDKKEAEKAAAADNDAALKDLEYQVSQIRGRLDAANREAEGELAALDAALKELGGRKASVEKELAALAASLRRGRPSPRGKNVT